LLSLVYSEQPVSLAAAWIFSATYIALLAREDHSRLPWLWLAAMSGILALRYVLARRFERTSNKCARLRSWEAAFTVGAALTGLCWGTIGWYTYGVASSSLRMIVLLLLGGVVATASRTIAGHFVSFCLSAVLAAAPLLARLIAGGRDDVLLTVFLGLYAVLMLGLGRSFQRTITQSLRLQLENAALADRLQEDIIARRHAEQALRESEEQLRFAQFALDHARDLVALLDAEGKLLRVSAALCRFTGRTPESLASLKIWQTFPNWSAEEYAKHWAAIKAAETGTFEFEVTDGAGMRKPVEVNATYVVFNGREAICAIARDLSPRRAAEHQKAGLERQLQETQRLESLGVLAGGIAHDFNNLLTAILANTTLARESLDRPSALGEMLGQIETASNQAAGLCRQMLAYAGRGQLRVESLDLSAVIAESARLLEMAVARRARLELQLAPKLTGIVADASQVRQVVLNLVHNAADAISRPDGRIVVSTHRIRIDERLISAARIRAEVPLGEGVAIVVSDNGSGMDRKTMDRIFEPFFTTKFTGRGLGLPAVLGIVRSHRALLSVESTPGQGSTFRVVFSATQAPPRTVAAPTAPPVVRHTGRVLVIDDEEAVRGVARRVLERLGLDVEVAPDGASALAIVPQQAEPFTLLLIDMTMPGLDGAETLRELRQRGVRAPAIVMSGLSDEQVRDRLPGADFELLHKPFDVSALRDKVETLLAIRRIR
jgi:PAS domain S-box-containing protein